MTSPLKTTPNLPKGEHAKPCQHTANRATQMIAYFSENIKYFRKKKGVKQKDLAAALDVSATHVALIEKGLRKPSVDLMLKICLFLNEEFNEMLIPQRHKVRDIGGKRVKPFPKRAGRGLSVGRTQKAKMDEIMENFGENVRKARKERGFNISELASYIDVTTARLRAIEKGEMFATFEEAIDICDFLCEDIVEMLMPQRIHMLILDGPSRTKPENTKTPCELKQEMVVNMILELDEDELGSIFKQLKARNFDEPQLHPQDTELADDFLKRATQRDEK